MAALALGGTPVQAQKNLPVIELSVGIHRIEAEVAASEGARSQGLMFRRSLPANRGMLFIFPSQGRHCMWMKNTFIPLSVAFIDEHGTILNIADMQPQVLDNHCARAPASYALEMNAGWFEGRGIGPGFRVSGLGKTRAPGR